MMNGYFTPSYILDYLGTTKFQFLLVLSIKKTVNAQGSLSHDITILMLSIYKYEKVHLHCLKLMGL